MLSRYKPVLALLALIACVVSAEAETLPDPEGAVILTVSGALTRANTPDGSADFDRAQLEALEQRVIATETPWFEGPQAFSGPTLATLMAHIGAQGSGLRIVALNDYATTLPWSDLTETGVILATRLNGAEMSVRNHGPLFIIYPFDEMPSLRNEVYFSRSAWQVARIEVLP